MKELHITIFLQLLQAIYSLKQAGRAWWKALNKSTTELGYTHLTSDPGLYIHHGLKVIAVIYVDDAQFYGSDEVNVI